MDTDTDLTQRIREANDALNAAIGDAQRAGLHVTARVVAINPLTHPRQPDTPLVVVTAKREDETPVHPSPSPS